MPSMVDALDEPIGDPAAVNTVLICRAAGRREGPCCRAWAPTSSSAATASTTPACWLPATARRPAPPVPPSRARSASSRWPWDPRPALGPAGPSASSSPRRWPRPAFRRSYTQYEPAELQDLLQPHLAPARPDAGRRARPHRSTGFTDPVNRMCMTDLQLFLVGLNLTYTDRSSMAASTEVRVPYVDIEVARAAFRATGAQKINGRSRKDILKRAAAGVLPDTIVNRPKGLFSVPCGRGSGGTWPRWSTTCCPTASS